MQKVPDISPERSKTQEFPDIVMEKKEAQESLDIYSKDDAIQGILQIIDMRNEKTDKEFGVKTEAFKTKEEYREETEVKTESGWIKIE